jgi:hypothetical protein
VSKESGSEVRLALGLWLATATVVAVVALLLGYSPLSSHTWSRWDSEQYVDVARDGYDLFRCAPESGLTGWCGDAGWFPAYPWIIRALHELGLPLRGTAVILSWVLAGATIALLWATFLRREARSAIVVAVLFACFAPGQIYSYALSPISLLLFTMVAFFALLVRDRWAGAGVVGVVAALVHPVGLLLLPVAAVWLMAEVGIASRERFRRTALVTGPMLFAVLALGFVQDLETGRWNAYLLVQEKYGHELGNPLRSAWEALSGGGGTSAGGGVAIALQSALVLMVVVAVASQAATRRGSFGRADGLIIVWSFAALLLPLTLSDVSLQRAHAALLPIAVLVARLPPAAAYPIVAVTVVVAIAMEAAFLYGSVV